MHEKETEQNKTLQPPKPQAESIFAKEQTYGEKKHAFIFGTMINFWLNLVTSAGFTFWVAHSTNKVKLPFLKEFAPREAQTNLGKWMEKQFFMKGIENPVTRAERSQSMATLFTLLIPGHVIMIPSVLLGAKYKEQIVKYYDRKHYGDEAMDSPELQARHERIAAEDKPTVLGAVVSRLGSMIATQSVGRFIGTPDNFINKLGIKNFRGVDPVAIDIGGTVGEGLHKIAPETTEKVNKYFSSHGYTWSNTQMRNPKMAATVTGPYNQAIDNLSRYMTQDVLYTLVTSASVHPILNTVKKFIPGLTYKPFVKHKLAPTIPAQVTTQHASSPAPQAAEETAPVITDVKDIPDAKVSNITAESTIEAKPERNIAVAGA